MNLFFYLFILNAFSWKIDLFKKKCLSSESKNNTYSIYLCIIIIFVGHDYVVFTWLTYTNEINVAILILNIERGVISR